MTGSLTMSPRPEQWPRIHEVFVEAVWSGNEDCAAELAAGAFVPQELIEEQARMALAMRSAKRLAFLVSIGARCPPASAPNGLGTLLDSMTPCQARIFSRAAAASEVQVLLAYAEADERDDLSRAIRSAAGLPPRIGRGAEMAA